MHSEKNLLYGLLEMTIPLAVRPRIPPNQQLHESQLKFRPEQQQLQAWFSRQQPNLHTRDGTASHARRYGLTRVTVSAVLTFEFLGFSLLHTLSAVRLTAPLPTLKILLQCLLKLVG
jgi:hypothetical protein